MTLNQIKILVERLGGVSMNIKSKQIKYKVPRYIYYYMARKYTFATFEQIAKTIKRKGMKRPTHVTIFNGVQKYKQEIDANEDFKKLSDKVEKYILTKIDASEIPDVQVLQETKETKPLTDVQIITFKDLLKLNDIDLLNFRNTRLKPYLSMLKSRRVHNIKHVAGALLR